MSDMNTARPRIPSLATAGIAVLSLNGQRKLGVWSSKLEVQHKDETGKREGLNRS